MASCDDKAHPPFQLTVSTREVAPTIGDSASERSRGSFDGCGMSPSTLASPCPANNGFDVDVEALKPPRSLEQPRKSSIGAEQFNSDSSVWPDQNHWREKAKAAERKNRTCQCLAGLSKRANIAIKIMIGLLVIGVAIAVGFGISKSV